MPDLIFDGKCPIQAIVDNVESSQRELRANLMGDARVNGHFKKGSFFVLNRCRADGSKGCERVQGPEFRSLRIRQAIVHGINHSAEGERRIVHKVILKCTADRNRSLNESEIGLANRLRGELIANILEGGRISRNKYEP